MISAAHRPLVWNPTTAEDQAQVLLALEEVLASTHFCNSKRYPALLRYVVEQTLNGYGDEIKERTVGIDVFGRAPDYDTNLDTAVRYSAAEVRKRLALYYSDLADSPVVISLSPRSYRPEFLRLAPEAPADDEISEPASHPEIPEVSASERHPGLVDCCVRYATSAGGPRSEDAGDHQPRWDKVLSALEHRDGSGLRYDEHQSLPLLRERSGDGPGRCPSKRPRGLIPGPARLLHYAGSDSREPHRPRRRLQQRMDLPDDQSAALSLHGPSRGTYRRYPGPLPVMCARPLEAIHRCAELRPRRTLPESLDRQPGHRHRGHSTLLGLMPLRSLQHHLSFCRSLTARSAGTGAIKMLKSSCGSMS